MDRKKHWIVLLIALVVASIHSFIPEQYLTVHVLLRLLYFIPIVYVALHSGYKAGVITALIISLIFLPHFFISGASPEFIAGNIVAVILFILSGFIIGLFRESSATELSQRIHKTQFIQDQGTTAQKVLFYVDSSPLSLSAAQWFVKRYWRKGLSFVLLSVRSDSNEERAAEKVSGESSSESKESDNPLLDQITHALTGQGVREKDIQRISIILKEKIPISSKIMEFAKEYKADTILLCKHNKKKSEEFLFGDTAIQLVRKTNIPVVVVKGVEG